LADLAWWPLRDARESALLRTRLKIDEKHMIRTLKRCTPPDFVRSVTSRPARPQRPPSARRGSGGHSSSKARFRSIRSGYAVRRVADADARAKPRPQRRARHHHLATMTARLGCGQLARRSLRRPGFRCLLPRPGAEPTHNFWRCAHPVFPGRSSRPSRSGGSDPLGFASPFITGDAGDCAARILPATCRLAPSRPRRPPWAIRRRRRRASPACPISGRQRPVSAATASGLVQVASPDRRRLPARRACSRCWEPQSRWAKSRPAASAADLLVLKGQWDRVDAGTFCFTQRFPYGGPPNRCGRPSTDLRGWHRIVAVPPKPRRMAKARSWRRAHADAVRRCHAFTLPPYDLRRTQWNTAPACPVLNKAATAPTPCTRSRRLRRADDASHRDGSAQCAPWPGVSR